MWPNPQFPAGLVTFTEEILKWKLQFLCRDSSLRFATFFIVMTRNFLVNFKLIHFLLWTKVPHKSPNFEIFKCSDENLPNSSCYFSNHKSVFLQILHQCLVSWKITLLLFFSSNIIYFGQKKPIKVHIFEIFICSDQNLSNSSCQFWNGSQFCFKFWIILHCHDT